jgi:hypothetical protein
MNTTTKALAKAATKSLATVGRASRALGRFMLGTSQQPNITALSVPAGPRNDAPFVASTTAPPTLVFRPGATFPNNGPVQQNVYTTGNSSGTDGYLVLQGVLAGSALFPAIPLPSSIVEFDFSLEGDSFAPTAGAAFGQNCRIKGLVNQTDGNAPEFIGNGFDFTGIVALQDIVFLGTLSDSPASLDLDGTVNLIGVSGHPILNAPASFVGVFNLNGNVTIQSDSIVLGAGATLTLNGVAGKLTLSAGAVSFGSGASLVIDLAPGDDGSGVDASFWGNASVTIAYASFAAPFTILTTHFSAEPPRSFTNEAQVNQYATLVGIANFVLTFLSENYTLGANLDLGDTVNSTTLQSSVDPENAVGSITTAGFQITTNPDVPTILRDIEINVQDNPCVPPGTLFNLTLAGTTGIGSDGNAFYEVTGGGSLLVEVDGNATLGDGLALALDAGSSVNFTGISGTLTLEAGCISFGSGAAATILLAPGDDGSGIDASFWGNASVQIQSHQFLIPSVIFRPSGTAVPSQVFTTEAQLNQYAGLVGAAALTLSLDFSDAADEYALAAGITLTPNSALFGVYDQVTGQEPTLLTNGFTVNGVVEIDNLEIEVSGVAAVTTPFTDLVLRNGTIVSTDGNLYYDVGDTTATIYLYDGSVLGEGSNAVLNIDAGGTLDVVVTSGSIVSANAIVFSAGGALNLLIQSGDGSGIDQRFWGMTGVSIVYSQAANTSPAPYQSILFQPGTLDAVVPTLFTEQAALQAYIDLAANVGPGSIIYCDFSQSSDDYSLTSDLVSVNGSIRGVIDKSFSPIVIPTLNTNGFTVSGVFDFEDINIQVSGASFIATTPVAPSLLRISGFFDIQSSGGGNFFYDITSTAITAILCNGSGRGGSGVGTLGDGTNPIFRVGSGIELNLSLTGSTTLNANAIAQVGTGQLFITVYSRAVKLDPSFTNGSLAWVTVTYNFTPLISNVTGGGSALVCVLAENAYLADTTAGPVPFELPNEATVPDGFWFETVLSNGTVTAGAQLANPLTMAYDGVIHFLDPDTGLLVNSWTSATSGNVRGRRIKWQISKEAGYWVSSG